MSWSKWIRQIHRWLSIAFTVAVITNIVAVVRDDYANWVGFLAVAPLALLLPNGLYCAAVCHQVAPRAKLIPPDMGSDPGR